MEHAAAAAFQVNRVADQASTHLRDLTDVWHNNGDKESVFLPDLSNRKYSHEYSQSGKKPTACKLNACTYLSARTVCLPKVKPVY